MANSNRRMPIGVLWNGTSVSKVGKIKGDNPGGYLPAPPAVEKFFSWCDETAHGRHGDQFKELPGDILQEIGGDVVHLCRLLVDFFCSNFVGHEYKSLPCALMHVPSMPSSASLYITYRDYRPHYYQDFIRGMVTSSADAAVADQILTLGVTGAYQAVSDFSPRFVSYSANLDLTQMTTHTAYYGSGMYNMITAGGYVFGHRSPLQTTNTLDTDENAFNRIYERMNLYWDRGYLANQRYFFGSATPAAESAARAISVRVKDTNHGEHIPGFRVRKVGDQSQVDLIGRRRTRAAVIRQDLPDDLLYVKMQSQLRERVGPPTVQSHLTVVVSQVLRHLIEGPNFPTLLRSSVNGPDIIYASLDTLRSRSLFYSRELGLCIDPPELNVYRHPRSTSNNKLSNFFYWVMEAVDRGTLFGEFPVSEKVFSTLAVPFPGLISRMELVTNPDSMIRRRLVRFRPDSQRYCFRELQQLYGMDEFQLRERQLEQIQEGARPASRRNEREDERSGTRVPDQRMINLQEE